VFPFQSQNVLKRREHALSLPRPKKSRSIRFSPEPDANGTVTIYALQPVRRHPADASGDAIDSNLLTTNLGPSAELALPYALADDHTFVERQPAQSGEIGGYCGYRHDRCLACQPQARTRTLTQRCAANAYLSPTVAFRAYRPG
jgi:hypothetical protein